MLHSYLVHPGETQAFYEHYAESASPWVSVIAGAPAGWADARGQGERRDFGLEYPGSRRATP